MALAQIREKQYKEEEKMSRLRESQRSCQELLQSQEGGTALSISCLDALSYESFSRKKGLLKLEEKALKATEELLEASKSRKIVEKLRDRELERYQQSMLQSERKFLDEIAMARFIRTGAESD